MVPNKVDGFECLPVGVARWFLFGGLVSWSSGAQEVPHLAPQLGDSVFRAQKAFVKHIVQSVKESGMTSVVGQCDYLHKIAWQGYQLAVVGIQLWKFVSNSWRMYLCPLVLGLTPEESSEWYGLAFEACLLLLKAEA